MPDDLVVRHSAPTLAGMKTANMFIHTFESENELKISLRKWNRKLSKKGLRAIPLRFRNKKALIYIYRPNMLTEDFKNNIAANILIKRGYSPEKVNLSIKKLIESLNKSEEFPHEIGLFLGYPPEDVQGYIENQKPCEIKGFWRVYSNEDEARKIFDKYKKCTKIYCDRVNSGKDLERMIVAS